MRVLGPNVAIGKLLTLLPQTEMLADIKKKLKPEGILYKDEALPRRPGQLHEICNKPMLTHDEMIALLAKNGFIYINSLDMNFRKKKQARKIFAFRKTENNL